MRSLYKKGRGKKRRIKMWTEKKHGYNEHVGARRKEQDA